MRTGVVIGALLIALSTGRLVAQQPAGPQAQPGLVAVGRSTTAMQCAITSSNALDPDAGAGHGKLTSMTFPIGTHVAVRTLGNKRGVVIAADRNGRYRVRVERITTWCREEDLAVPTEAAKKKRTGQSSQDRPPEPLTGKAAPAGRVDLHGLRVDEAIARVVAEIDRALRDGADRVEVVHGKGSGRIRNALHQHLASLSVVAAFRADPHNPGVTWVYFR